MTTTCAELEARLEALTAGDLDEELRDACERHLRICARCAALVELATVPVPSGRSAAGGLSGDVLARTSGPPCGAAEGLLVADPDDESEGGTPELLALHLAHCPRCAALARALSALASDLPAMAELAPGSGFVQGVLAASLPPAVRLRRWRRESWPQWVRRPRFALELAYAMTVFFVVLLSIPGTPLAAMPQRALELTRTSPLAALEQPVRAAWSDSAAARRLETEVERRLVEARRARQQAPRLLDASRQRIRTFFAEAASWWEKATEDASSRPQQSTEETS